MKLEFCLRAKCEKTVDFERTYLGPFPRYSLQVVAVCRGQRNSNSIGSATPEVFEVKGQTLTPCISETVKDIQTVLNAFDSARRAVQVGQIS
jgi:hypothetical protein